MLSCMLILNWFTVSVLEVKINGNLAVCLGISVVVHVLKFVAGVSIFAVFPVMHIYCAAHRSIGLQQSKEGALL